MTKKMTFLQRIGIATQLYCGFAVVLIVTLCLAVVSVSRVDSIEAALQATNKVRNNELEPLYAAREALAQTGIAARNAYIFKDATAANRELDVVDEQKKRYLTNLAQLDAGLGRLPEYAKMKTGMLQMASALERPRKYLQENKIDEFGQFLVEECIPLRRQIVSDIDVLLLTIQKHNNDTTMAATTEATQGRYWIIGLSVISVLLCGAVGTLIVRSLLGQLGGEPAQASNVARAIANGQLYYPVDVSRAAPSSMMYAMSNMRHALSDIVLKVRNGTQAIASASHEIASGNGDLSSRTETQAAALSQVAQSMSRLVESVHHNAEYAKQASGLASTASSVSVEGGSAVNEVVETMHLIHESSKKIVEIISVIDGIAFQTNILALNAAVEAARAGEQGRGFAVVAGEVRNLAHRSAAAAKEIKALIEDSVTKVSAGTVLVGRAGDTIRNVVDGVHRVREIMDQISGATNSQRADIEHVCAAIARLDDMTLQNSALVEEAAAAAESLRAQAAELNLVVNTFQVEHPVSHPSPRLGLPHYT